MTTYHNPLLHTRHSDIFLATENHTPIVVVGAGTIGSWVILALSKLGLNDIRVIDHDEVEIQNISTQAYSPSHVGMMKVNAIASIVKELVTLETYCCKFEEVDKYSLRDSPIIISAVDNMEARKLIFEYVKSSKDVLVDGRMGGEVIKVYNVIDEEDRVLYESTLESYPLNDELKALSELPCTAKGIIDVSFIISSIISSCVRKIIMKEKPRYEIIADMKKINLI